MNFRDIEVGKTYSGKKGKPRTVVAKNGSESFFVHYTTANNPEKIKVCWCTTFADWVQEEVPTT